MKTEERVLESRHSAYGAGYAKLPQRQDCDPKPITSLFELKQYVDKNSVVLDVGCGKAYKTLPLAKRCRQYYGIDPSTDLLGIARQEASITKADNTIFKEGRAGSLSFDDASIDIVISQLAPHNAAEAYRVLRPYGIYYLEKTGAGDKRKVKLEFGSDEEGPRGYLCDMEEGERRRKIEAEFIECGFRKVRTASMYFDCYYPTLDDLILLLQEVSFTVRDFSLEKDEEILKRIEEKYMTGRGIKVRRHEIIVVGEKLG